MAEFPFYYAKGCYDRSRDRFKTLISQIKAGEQSIITNPCQDGTAIKTKSLLGYRHLRLQSGVRIWYVLCGEMQRYHQADYNTAVINEDREYHACSMFCKEICIERSGNSIGFLKVMNHDEQTQILQKASKKSILPFFK